MAQKPQKNSHRIQKRLLKKCDYQDCIEGLVKGMFGSLSDCAQCNGLGLLDAHTGEALPDREVIRQLSLRFMEQRQYIRELQLSNSDLQQALNKATRSR